MIRIETEAGWTLIEHREHARLAGRLAAHWGNAEFHPPEPRDDILEAVSRHDDAWAVRDAIPFLNRQGKPGAFSAERVGNYGAYEEIGFAEFIGLRERATEAVAAENPYAAVIVSMHTFDLIATQADVEALSEPDRRLRRKFLDGQLRRQIELIGMLEAAAPLNEDLASTQVLRAFEFLQACDSLSLLVCARFPRPLPLRHHHPRRDETFAELVCTPLGNDSYRVTPYPFDGDRLSFEAPCRDLPAKMFADENAFRAAYSAAPIGRLVVTIVR